jgi:hypothetical protein
MVHLDSICPVPRGLNAPIIAAMKKAITLSLLVPWNIARALKHSLWSITPAAMI